MTPRADLRTHDSNMPLLVFAALVVSVGYFYTVTDRCWRGVMDCFDNVNPLTAPAPFRYRILAPIIEGVFSPTNEPYRAYILDAAFHGLLVALLMPALYVWLKRFLEPSRALVGVFITAVCFMLSFQLYMPFGTTIIELVILVYALNILDDSIVVYGVLLALATLNRETSILLVGAYAAYHGRCKVKESIYLLVLWGAVTVGLHIVLGAAPHIYGLQNTLERNLEGIAQVIMYNTPFVVLWLMVVARYRTSSRVLRRFAWVALAYAGCVVMGALWAEVRLWLVILPLVLPIALS